MGPLRVIDDAPPSSSIDVLDCLRHSDCKGDDGFRWGVTETTIGARIGRAAPDGEVASCNFAKLPLTGISPPASSA